MDVLMQEGPVGREEQEAPMSLTKVWVQTQGDGLVRADQVTGMDAHQTPALTGKPSHWLLDVVLSAPIGSGTSEGWGVTVLHRILIQTAQDPGSAPAALARLIAQLDLISAAGIISTSREEPGAATGDSASGVDVMVAAPSPMRFRFVPFPAHNPGTTPALSTSEYL
jgi:hypothetical protein